MCNLRTYVIYNLGYEFTDLYIYIHIQKYKNIYFYIIIIFILYNFFINLNLYSADFHILYITYERSADTYKFIYIYDNILKYIKIYNIQYIAVSMRTEI